MAKAQSFWLVKSEPDCFSIEHLARAPKQTTCWSGVRNYQARNMLRDQMHLGDRVLFYHSSADPPVVAGTAVIVREGYPDHTAWDPKDDHFDPKASPENPIWQMVDIKLEQIFEHPVPIGALREVKELAAMELLRKGSRLSVQPVRPREFELVLELAAAGETAERATKTASARRSKATTKSKQPAPKTLAKPKKATARR